MAFHAPNLRETWQVSHTNIQRLPTSSKNEGFTFFVKKHIHALLPNVWQLYYTTSSSQYHIQLLPCAILYLNHHHMLQRKQKENKCQWSHIMMWREKTHLFKKSSSFLHNRRMKIEVQIFLLLFFCRTWNLFCMKVYYGSWNLRSDTENRNSLKKGSICMPAKECIILKNILPCQLY